MEFVKQHTSLPVRDLDELLFKNRKKKEKFKHSSLLPNSIRCIICGPSNCGKTNVVISLIENPNGLCFENIYIFSKSLYQPKYQYLKKILRPIKGMGLYMFSNNDSVISPELAKRNSIFVFDDVICDKQNNIKEYFCMGRHRDIDCFYLSQSYTHIPKHLIRENANLIVVFKQDELNLKHIYNDCGISSDMTFEKFKDVCRSCWVNKYDFLVIDVENEINNGKYRKGFDCFIQNI